MNISNISATVLLNALNSAIGSNAKIEFYTSADVKLATLTAGENFGTVSARSLTAGPITRDNAADAAGVASYVTVSTSADVEIVRMTVGEEITMTTTSIIAGQPVEISGIVFSI